MKTSLKDFWLRLLRGVLASAALCVAPHVDAIEFVYFNNPNNNAELFGDMKYDFDQWGLLFAMKTTGPSQGRVVWHFPDPSIEPPPLVSFKAVCTMHIIPDPGVKGSCAFFFSPPGATNDGRNPGTGLVVAVNNLTNAEPDTKMDLTVYWQGQTLASTIVDTVDTSWGDYERGVGDFIVSYSPNTGLTVDFYVDFPNTSVYHGMVANRPLPGYDQVVDGTWQFGFAGVVLDHGPDVGWPIRVGVLDEDLTAVTSAHVTSPGPGYTRTSSEGQGDSFEIVVADEQGYPENITVTAVSSNPAVFDSTNLTVTATSPTQRTITLAPLKRGHGDTTVMLSLDSGRAGPIGRYSYVHRVQPNVAPGIHVADADLHIDQPQGFTRAIPFSIASSSWAVTNLVPSIASFPTNFIDPRSIFLMPTAGADASQWKLVFTPRPGVAGKAAEPIVLRVADPLGDHSTASVALEVHVPSFPPTVLGSGSALSLNTASSVLQYAVNLGGTPGSGLGQTATLEAWVYATALPDPSLNFIAQIGHPDSRAGLALALQSDGSPSLANWVNDFYPTNATTKVALNQWHHVAAVVNGQAVSLYVDGVLSASGTLPQMPNVAVGPTCVGIEPLGGQNRHWVGHLDEVRVWSVAKTASEIAASYNRSVRSDAPGLVRYYRCEEGFVSFQGGPGGSGNTAADGFVWLMDSSVNQAHLPLVGYPSFVPGASLVTQLDMPQNQPVTFGLASAFSNAALGGTVGLAREIFFGPDSATLTNGLLAAPGWPESPEVTVPNAVGLEVLPGGPSNYGERIAGHVLAPVSGVYTFAIASVNEAQLYLSPNDHPDGRALIASSPASGVSFRQFDAFPAQQTGQVTLTAGQLYYYEVRHQVQTVGAVKPHLSVQWTLPGGVVESPIPASRLRPLGPEPSVPIEVTTSVEPDWGKLTVQALAATYHPSSNFFGTDTVAFTIKQGTPTALPVVVELNVINPNPNPVAGSGNALLLGGQPGGVQSDVSFDLGGQSFTVETWARRSNESTNLQALFSFLSDPATNRPHASFGWFPGGFVGLQITNTLPHPDLRSEAPYTDTGWHHYAAVFDAATGQREIFRDGVSLGTVTVSGATLGEGRLFLGSVGGTSGFFEGALDEFRLWTRARTREEILGTMGSPLVGTEDDLLVYYRFDEGNGLGVYDSSKPKVNGVSFDATILDPAGWITTPPTNFARLTVPRNSPGQSVFLPGFSFGRQPLTYQITGTPKNGSLVADPLVPGRYTYTPLPGFHGADGLRYTVTANGL
ncbi:MAG: hypothetical protein KIT22_06645, partial [Verrucomicrobiae bacterium]|nr:hypothetical protein [Verrucomicrobiae bacterium]